MKAFTPVYIPVGVPTFHLESARKELEASKRLLRSINERFVCPEDILLSVDALSDYLEGLTPDLIVFQNTTFANSAYMAEALRRTDAPLLIWTLREPEVPGGRLGLNSLTGAYSAANTARALRDGGFEYVLGSPSEEAVREKLSAVTAAARLKLALRSLKLASVGHTPQGFGFGRALDSELMRSFGVTLESIEARELMDLARSYTDEECAEYLEKTARATCGLDKTPEENRLAHARLYRAYSDYIEKSGVRAISSRCWPDFFTAYGAPVCAALSMLGDDGVAAACEADAYGALSMYMGMELSGRPVFFGDPVELREEDNTLTFWHCGAAACSLARKDSGAAVGVHPNRKVGPVMDFGCQAFPKATVFRVGRKPDGSFRFFIAGGEAVDAPKRFNGTSVVVRMDSPCRELVEKSVLAGFEPHFAVINGDCAGALSALARMLDMEVWPPEPCPAARAH